MPNPFTLGIAQNDEFCDRIRETGELVRHAQNGNNVVIFSPRRYGKSSLVKRVLRELERKDFLAVYIDLFPIHSEQDFISRLAAGIIKGIGRGTNERGFGQRTRNLFKRITPTLEIGFTGIKLSLKLDKDAPPELLLEDLMEGLYGYVKKRKLRACIVLDEFQEITDLPQSKRIEGLLRSHMQLHKEIAYFYIGSRRRTLQDMFTQKSRPFYKSAFLYPLEIIPKKEFVPYIQERFKSSGKECSPAAAALIFEKSFGYPYYVQKLASISWDLAKKRNTSETVESAYRLLLETEKADFEGIWSGLTLTQKAIMKALAQEPTTSPYGRHYLERYQLSIGGTQKAIEALRQKDLIESIKEVYQLTDPIMAAWLKDEIQ